MIIYEEKTSDWSLIKDNCNTNNHIDLTDDDIYDKYKADLEETNKKNWIKWFPDNSIEIPLNKYFCEVLENASYIGFMKHAPPKIYEDELELLINYVDSFLKENNKWFIRLSPNSPKDGIYGKGPLLSAKEIVYSLATSYRAYTCFHYVNLKNINKEILYISKWKDEWQNGTEFRVFIYNKKITCISQYNCYNDMNIHENIKDMVQDIINFYETIREKIPLESYVLDLICLDRNVEFIEINSFGKDRASGSALFHWINDYDIMYNSQNINVRYIKNN